MPRKPLDSEKRHDRLPIWHHTPETHFMKTGDASDAVNHSAKGVLSRGSWNKRLSGLIGIKNMVLGSRVIFKLSGSLGRNGRL